MAKRQFLIRQVWGPSICISIKFPVICSYWTKNHSLRSCCHPLTTKVAVHCLAHSRVPYTHSLIFNPHWSPVRMDWQVKETCPGSETRGGGGCQACLSPKPSHKVMAAFSTHFLQNKTKARTQTGGVRTHLPTVGNNLKQYSFKWFHPWQCNIAFLNPMIKTKQRVPDDRNRLVAQLIRT